MSLGRERSPRLIGACAAPVPPTLRTSSPLVGTIRFKNRIPNNGALDLGTEGLHYKSAFQPLKVIKVCNYDRTSAY